MSQQNKQSIIPRQVRDDDAAALIERVPCELDQVEQGDTVMTDETTLITDAGHLYLPPEFDALRDAIFAFYALLAKRKAALPALSDAECEGRQLALYGIEEILEGQSLAAFSATHLDVLEMLFAYWRELEVDGELRAPGPDGEPVYSQSTMP
jgi:hypothetical protein